MRRFTETGFRTVRDSSARWPFAYSYRIRLEESALLERHGAAFREYRARTAMLIPGLW